MSDLLFIKYQQCIEKQYIYPSYDFLSSIIKLFIENKRYLNTDTYISAHIIIPKIF